jgi:hypothetical protein
MILVEALGATLYTKVKVQVFQHLHPSVRVTVVTVGLMVNLQWVCIWHE